jgi:VWFA-related protein
VTSKMLPVVWFSMAVVAAAAQTAAPSAPGSQLQSPQRAITSSQADRYGLRVTSQLVALDVVVTNKHGEPVSGLTADDFEVYENKSRQQIQTVEASSAATSTLPSLEIHSTADLDRLAPQAPVSILVLDEVMMQFQDEAFARYALEKYLATEGDKLSLPTLLLAVSPEHQMVLHDYTTSRKEILEALDHHLSKTNWNAKNPNWTGKLFMASVASLIGVANATAGHAGHKNIVWIGHGFPDMPWDQMSSPMENQFKEALAICTNRLRDARATLYRVDPGGVAGGPPVSHADPGALENGTPESIQMGDPFGDQADFDAMAQATGGRALYGRNDVDRMIGQFVRDGRNFYTITYRPATTSTDPAAFRAIHVAMKNPALVASTRRGYFGDGFKDSPGPKLADILPHPDTFDLGVAADGLMVYDAVPLTVEPTTDKPGQFRISFPTNAVVWTPQDGKETCEVTVLLTSYDAKGARLHREGRVVGLSAATLPGQPDARAVHILLTTPMSPQPSRLRVLVQDDATGRIGSGNYTFAGPGAHAASPAKLKDAK